MQITSKWLTMKFIVKTLQVTCLLVLAFSCKNVEEGYRPEYKVTSAEFTVELETFNRGVKGDTLTFRIRAKSKTDIKSIVVKTSISGGAGTGYVINTENSDPLIDHSYGRVQPGVKEIDLKYYYVINHVKGEALLSFVLVDHEGKKEIEHPVIAVPKIVKYQNIVLYTNSSVATDGFSTLTGDIFKNLPDYEELNEKNEAIQASIDIVFLCDSVEAMLVGPYSSWLISDMKNKNKTLFKTIQDIDASEFSAINSAALSIIAEKNEVDKGTTSIKGIKVGDIIGFRTDFASANPYKYGLIKINSIRPANAPHYPGLSYLIDMDILTQIKE